MKFADLNFAWADARAAVRASSSVKAKKVAKTVIFSKINQAEVGKPTMDATAVAFRRAAAEGHKAPAVQVIKSTNVDPRWVDVLSLVKGGVSAAEAVESLSLKKDKESRRETLMSLTALRSVNQVAAVTPFVAEAKEESVQAPVARRWTAAEKAAAKAAKKAAKALAVIAKKAAVKAMKLEKVKAKAAAELAAAQEALKKGATKEEVAATSGVSVAAAAVQAEFRRMIASIQKLQGRTYKYDGRNIVVYTDSVTGSSETYNIEWNAHVVVGMVRLGS